MSLFVLSIKEHAFSFPLDEMEEERYQIYKKMLSLSIRWYASKVAISGWVFWSIRHFPENNLA